MENIKHITTSLKFTFGRKTYNLTIKCKFVKYEGDTSWILDDFHYGDVKLPKSVCPHEFYYALKDVLVSSSPNF